MRSAISESDKVTCTKMIISGMLYHSVFLFIGIYYLVLFSICYDPFTFGLIFYSVFETSLVKYAI